MAITNTRTVGKVEVQVVPNGDPVLLVMYEHVFDDSEDDALPVKTQVGKNLHRYHSSMDESDEIVNTPTDISGEDQLVRDICAAVWTD